MNQLKKERERAKRFEHPLFLVLMDVDNFKQSKRSPAASAEPKAQFDELGKEDATKVSEGGDSANQGALSSIAASIFNAIIVCC